MPRRRTFLAAKRQGRLYFRDRRAMDLHVSAFAEGAMVQVTIGAIEKTRSNAQNRYYWGVVVAYVREKIGLTPKEAHALLGAEFLMVEERIELPGGKVKTYGRIRSTSELTTAEFERYMDDCRMWAGVELGVGIPTPNEIDLGQIPDYIT